MANIFRGPLFSRNHRRPDPAATWSGPNLLTSTLVVAAAALPFNNAGAFPQAHHPSHRRSTNADTTQDSPATLLFQPDQIATSVPETLPIYRAPVTLTNTSFRNSALLSTVVTPAPFVIAPWTSPRLLWKPLDTSTGTPKGLIADATKPFFNPSHLLLDRLRPVADTSQDTPLTLLLPAVPAVPFVNLPHLPSPRWAWKPLDTSAGMPKVFTGDATVPFFSPAQMQVDRLRPVVDTSQGLGVALATYVPPTPGQGQHVRITMSMTVL